MYKGDGEVENLFLRVKGIVEKDGKYLVIKRWVDDRIPDPFVWEFVDGVVEFGEEPDKAMLRCINEILGVDGTIKKIEYTWSQMIEETQCVGIAYLCHVSADDTQFVLPEEFGDWEWIKREQFEEYIENRFVLDDLNGVTL